MQSVCFIPFVAYMHNYTEWAMKNYPTLRFAPVLAILRRSSNSQSTVVLSLSPPTLADRHRSHVVGP